MKIVKRDMATVKLLNYILKSSAFTPAEKRRLLLKEIRRGKR